jgi:hypothetical protein
MAPTTQCVVDTGMPAPVASSTATEEPSPTAKPREGDMSVMRRPTVSITYTPYSAKPAHTAATASAVSGSKASTSWSRRCRR